MWLVQEGEPWRQRVADRDPAEGLGGSVGQIGDQTTRASFVDVSRIGRFLSSHPRPMGQQNWVLATQTNQTCR